MSDTMALIAHGQLHYSNILKTEKCEMVDKLPLQHAVYKKVPGKEQDHIEVRSVYLSTTEQPVS